jgi:hypothetical protein
MTVLTDPASEWAKIEHEPVEPIYLMTRYVAALAVIPVLSGFVGACLIGAAVPGLGIVRTPIIDGLFGAVFGYAAAFAEVLLLGAIVNLLAPLFNGQRNFASAFNLVVYAATPVWLAGVFSLLPGLHFLMLMGFYGAYLVWTGLPRLMKSPRQTAPGYTAVVVLCAFALTLVIGAIERTLFGVSIGI